MGYTGQVRPRLTPTESATSPLSSRCILDSVLQQPWMFMEQNYFMNKMAVVYDFVKRVMRSFKVSAEDFLIGYAVAMNSFLFNTTLFCNDRF